MRSSKAVAAAFVVLGLCTALAVCDRSGKDGGDGAFEMYVSPNTIVPGAPCTWVTIHTDVAYRSVDLKSVSVDVDGNPVDVAYMFADSQGNIVVKLAFDDVVEAAGAGAATVSLTLVVNGTEMVASDTVTVKN